MDLNLEAILCSCLVAGCGIAMFLFCLISALKKQKKTEAAPQAPIYTERTIQATVIDQYCFVKTIGYKTPKTTKVFTVVFKSGDETIKLNVPEEMYDGFEKGQTGLLTIADNYLYSFVSDESHT